jgi:hypothetical protein
MGGRSLVNYVEIVVLVVIIVGAILFFMKRGEHYEKRLRLRPQGLRSFCGNCGKSPNRGPLRWKLRRTQSERFGLNAIAISVDSGDYPQPNGQLTH